MSTFLIVCRNTLVHIGSSVNDGSLFSPRDYSHTERCRDEPRDLCIFVRIATSINPVSLFSQRMKCMVCTLCV